MINESAVATIKHTSRAMAATIIALVFIICAFATTAFAGMTGEYNVVVDDNGTEYTIVTNEEQPTEILKEANITLGANDKLDISGFDSGKGGTIVIDRLNAVNVKLNDVIKTFNVYADTVADAFNEIGMDVKGCTLNYSGSDLIQDGMVITVTTPISVTVEADGASVSVGVAQGNTVADVLSVAGITLGENDYVEPAANTVVENNTVVSVYRVETKTVTEKESIAFDTQKNTDDSLELGTVNVQVKGVNGEKEVTYQVTYVNGVESSRTQLTSKTTKEPVTEVQTVGTKRGDVTPNGVESSNGFTLGQVISGKYTHYCACATCNGNSRGITTSGRRISTSMENPYYIACNWLPLGSVIDVDGELYTVVDRGGSGLSRTGRIDIFTPGSHSTALRKGTGKCTITIVRLGW